MTEPTSFQDKPEEGLPEAVTGWGANVVQGELEDEISVLSIFITLARHKRLVIGFPFLVALLSVAFTLSLTNIFTASTKVLPPQQSQSTSAALLSQLGGGLGNLLGGVAGGLKGPSDTYIAMLKSRTVADKLIQRFNLLDYYKIDSAHPSDAYKALSDVTKISSGKDGIITIEVDDKDPKRAADIANAYVEEVIRFTSVLAITEASQRRLFFEQQLASAKDSLAKAEAAARYVLQTRGLIKVDDQGRAIVETTARLRAQIAAKNIQIAGMRAFANDNNPELQSAQLGLDAMKRELASLEGTGAPRGSSDGAGAAIGEGLRLLRDVKYNEVLFELLAKQYEVAKIDEAKESSVLQVMDRAIEPDRKSKPKRALLVFMYTSLAVLIALFVVIAREILERMRVDPVQSKKLAILRSHFKWRKSN